MKATPQQLRSRFMQARERKKKLASAMTEPNHEEHAMDEVKVETKWTPGPWAAAARKGSAWDLVVYKPGTSLEICQMFHDFTKGNSTGQANAHLTAAAPALYAVLEELQRLAPVNIGDGDDPELDAAYSRINDVLAAARGEAKG